MGMYTEFIFGCSLSKNTPKVCIDALNYIINNDEVALTPEVQEFINKYDLERLFLSTSYYFGAASPVNKFHWDDIGNAYQISTRSNLKNYENQIQTFLEYIKPYVESGSGEYDIYAYVHFETLCFPTIYTMQGVYYFPEPKD